MIGNGVKANLTGVQWFTTDGEDVCTLSFRTEPINKAKALDTLNKLRMCQVEVEFK